jgi:hypothetical protein
MAVFVRNYFYKILFVLLLTNGYSHLLFSQDSIPPVHKNTFKPAFDFDQRFSFIRNKRVNIWGVRAGVLVNEKFKVGVGAYFLNDHLKSMDVDSLGSPLYSGHRDLYFGTVYFEPFIFRRKYVELSVPIEAGFGKSIFRVYANNTSDLLHTTTSDFLPAGAGLSLSFKLPPIGRFKPTRWFGINFLVGYRYCFLENTFHTDYDGMYWSVSGAIFLDRFSDDYQEWHGKRKAKKCGTQNL